MHTQIHFRRTLSALLLLAMLLLAMLGSGLRPALAAGPLNSTACSTVGTATTCSLWAKTGTLALPGTSVAIWGYADSAGGAPVLPGPTLIANQGDSVTVTLTNNLPAATSLKFEGQELIPDQVGVAPDGMKSYTFTASQPGIFLYEAGLLAGAQYQPAMGLSGALIVRPGPAAAGQAYTSSASAYTDETLVVLSEIDPALNNSASPAGFDMRNFKPKFFLINGKAYPDTDPIGVAAGSKVLLRYVNAGQQTHTMAILGMQQTFLSLAGVELPHYRTGASQLLMPGQSADAIATVPPATAGPARFPLYEAGALLTNNGGQAFGGMLAFLEVGGTPPGGDTQGPAASGLGLLPNPTNGSVAVAVAATISDAASGGGIISAVEFFIDAPGVAGEGAQLDPVLAPFDNVSEAVSGSIAVSTLAGLASGNHTIYVHGQDAAGNWGSHNTIVLNLDKTGPATTGIVQTPAVTNGTVAVNISATSIDSASGGSNVTAGEYRIDGGAIQSMNPVASPAPIVSLTATINAATMSGLAVGSHTLEIRAVDALGNLGVWAGAPLIVDKTGPATSGIDTTPDATNGTSSVRVDALVTDLAINVTNAELFIDTVGAPGTGLAMMSKDGAFNELGEDVYQTISQAQANALTAGAHTIIVRGKDAAGNWGATAAYTLISDKVKPTISGLSAVPNPTNTTNTSTTSFTLSATANGTGTNVIQAEWFEGADPGLGKGNQFIFTQAASVNLSASIDYVALGWTPGSHTVNVRAKDAAINWSTTASVVVNVVYPNNVFADGFETGSFSAWSATGGTAGRISVSNVSPQAGTYRMAAQISAGASGYVQDNTPFVDRSYHARFYFNPNGYTTGNGGNPTAVTIYSGLNSANATVFQVQYRRSTNTGYQVRLGVTRAGGTTFTNWYTITNSAWNAIEIDWSSAASATVRFYTAGVLRQTLTGLNTSANALDSVRLGPQGTTPNTGTVYFDSFVSTRRTLIGP